MVVVAIIAILSTIAVPSYQVFQAKARQKEGFALLGAYFNAAQAARIEYGFFPGEFPATGFAPNGQLGYTLIANGNTGGGTEGTLPYNQTNYDACVSTLDTSADANCPAGYREWSDVQAGNVTAGSERLGSFAPSGTPTANATTFTVFAAGVISLKAGRADEYQIDQTKSLSVVSDGLK